MLSACVTNQLPFEYVLNDLWFASVENMVHIKQTLLKDFVMPLKENRNVSFEAPGTPMRHFVPVSSLTLEGRYRNDCLAAFVKMERLRMSHHLNHFAMKAQLYKAALASAFQQLQVLKEKCPAA